MFRYNSKLLFQLVAALLLILTISTSCKKDKPDSDAALNDLAYNEVKDWYLWTDKLPTKEVFNPQASKDIYAVMEKVKTYQPLDKWSFAQTKEETAQTERGESTDFGFMVKFLSPSDLRVNYVYANSSAGKLGVKRTWRIAKINSRTIDGANRSDVDYLNNIFFGSAKSASFEFIKPDDSNITLTILKSQYPLNTVLYKNVYDNGSKKIGYLVFNEFSGESSILELRDAFIYFEQQAVNEMIVDLRYNRGGYVLTQDLLVNLLAPVSVGTDQKLMYTHEFNEKNSSENRVTYFKKSGNLNLSRVIFIVSPSSASASELLINNLRPVMPGSKLIGDTRTYGKPVGFFPLPVGKFDVYPVSFKTTNSEGSADYFGGFPVDKNVGDDLIHDFGDEREANLRQAISFLTTGKYIASTFAERSTISAAEIKKTAEVNSAFADNIAARTIENRPDKMPRSIRALQK